MNQGFSAYEQNQQKRILMVILWTALVAATVLGVFDLRFHTWPSVISLFALALVCIPALLLNARGRIYLAALLMSIIGLMVITINLYDGNGVRDPGILAYPVLILIGTLFFGKRAASLFALAACGSLALIVFLEVGKIIHPRVGPTGWDILVPMVTLLAATAIIVWFIVDNNERSLERVRASEAELSKNYDLTLEAWAHVMEYRDRETEGHSRRLVELGTRLARAIGCTEDEITALRRGALLHDIGKLAIPDEILLKPAALTAEEMKVIELHTIYAKQMLSSIPFLEPAISVAYSHHERWDGSGYPEGLKGEAIPLLARIFAIVDTWDALSSERVYRPAWKPQAIRAYIRENAGIKFDPHIAEVFLKDIQPDDG